MGARSGVAWRPRLDEVERATVGVVDLAKWQPAHWHEAGHLGSLLLGRRNVSSNPATVNCFVT